MSDKAAQFRALAAQLTPHQDKADAIKAKMVEIAHELNIEIVGEAFPAAHILRITAIAEIKPTSLARAARETTATLIERHVFPDLIVIDEARKLVTLAKKPAEVPPAGPTPKKRRKK